VALINKAWKGPIYLENDPSIASSPLRMPIAALPQTTVRAIGSTSVISDPCSIVKELLENSLDAHATAIFIEISQNTVDVIQVKDNGHGIPSEDHPFVCRRAFTSKIETVDDLRKLGGKSLGFRGEALASAAEVCGGVTVTTRVEADPVGFCMKYGRNGELIRYVVPKNASEHG
jgi:DNA mismatch repair protein MutL